MFKNVELSILVQSRITTVFAHKIAQFFLKSDPCVELI